MPRPMSKGGAGRAPDHARDVGMASAADLIHLGASEQWMRRLVEHEGRPGGAEARWLGSLLSRPVTNHERTVRAIVEECWVSAAGVERMRTFLTAGYVHHSVLGDTDADGFAAGLAWLDGRIGERAYRVEHVVVSGELAAALLSWSGVRSDDGSAVTGSGAYHCRFEGGLISEDWDVFFPAG